MDLFRLKSFSIFCLLWTTILCEGFEPRCSKFEYDEQILTKMIKVEFQLSQMQKGYEEMRNEILEAQKNVEKETETMKETIEKAIEQSSKNFNTLEEGVKDTGDKLVKDVNDATTAMEVTQQQTEAKLMRLSADLRTFQNETIHNLTNTLKTPDVFFMASITTGTISRSNKDKFVFGTVLEDRSGGGYNNNDGIFTVPVTGEYLFTTQLCNSADSSVYLAFTVDDVRKKVTKAWGYNSFTCTTATLIYRVKTGTRVAVESTSTTIAYCNASRYGCYFSGYLLKQTQN